MANAPFLAPPPRTDLIWIAIDFDGTVVHSEAPQYVPMHPVNDSVRKIWELVNAGYKIAIHTARPWAEYETIEMWLNHFGVPFHRIQCGKLLAKIYIDDRNGPDITADSWLPQEGKK